MLLLNKEKYSKKKLGYKNYNLKDWHLYTLIKVLCKVKNKIKNNSILRKIIRKMMFCSSSIKKNSKSKFRIWILIKILNNKFSKLNNILKEILCKTNKIHYKVNNNNNNSLNFKKLLNNNNKYKISWIPIKILKNNSLNINNKRKLILTEIHQEI